MSNYDFIKLNLSASNKKLFNDYYDQLQILKKVKTSMANLAHKHCSPKNQHLFKAVEKNLDDELFRVRNQLEKIVADEFNKGWLY